MSETTKVEPWLRGTLCDVPAVPRAVLHALELAREDAERWVSGFSVEQMSARPFGLPSVGFQLRHIAGSLDRLLTYAEGLALDQVQLAALAGEDAPVTDAGELLAGFAAALASAADRVRAFAGRDLEEQRFVGRGRLPTTLGGLLVHCADHTQRHAGQLVTTAKLVATTWPALP